MNEHTAPSDPRGVPGSPPSGEPPSQYAGLAWEGPYALPEVIPGLPCVCWEASDEAAGWRAILIVHYRPDGRVRPEVGWTVSRPVPGGRGGGGLVLEEKETFSLDAAVVDAERFIEGLLEMAPAERLLAQVLGRDGAR